MTLSFEVTTTGPQLAHQLAYDPEEFWYMLREMVDLVDKGFCDEVAKHDYQKSNQVPRFLRELARKLEAGV